MDIKTDIIKLLIEMETGKYSNILLNNFFNKNKYEYKEKSFISEVFYGVIRNKIFLEYLIQEHAKKIKKKDIFYLLEISIYQGIYMDSDEKGVVWEAVEIVKKKYGNNIGNFVNGVLRNIFRNYKNIMEKLKKESRYDILYSYPKWIVDVFKEKYNENYIVAMENYKKPAYFSIRINTLKYNSIDFEKYLSIKKIKILNKIGEVYYLENGRILESDLFKEGKIFVQDGSSYLAALMLEGKSNEKILDACSAPGTKTIVIAESMKNQGEIVAVDVYEHKIKLILENAKQAGVNIIKPMCIDVRELDSDKYSFNKILVDVPCSGIGVIRKKPETLYNKNPLDIKKLSELQYDILEKVSKLLIKGGTLLYSTCTILDTENTENIEKFIKNNKNFIVEKINIDYNINYEYDKLGGVQINYNEEYLDGFYFIKLKRVD